MVLCEAWPLRMRTLFASPPLSSAMITRSGPKSTNTCICSQEGHGRNLQANANVVQGLALHARLLLRLRGYKLRARSLGLVHRFNRNEWDSPATLPTQGLLSKILKTKVHSSIQQLLKGCQAHARRKP